LLLKSMVGKEARATPKLSTSMMVSTAPSTMSSTITTTPCLSHSNHRLRPRTRSARLPPFEFPPLFLAPPVMASIKFVVKKTQISNALKSATGSFSKTWAPTPTLLPSCLTATRTFQRKSTVSQLLATKRTPRFLPMKETTFLRKLKCSETQ
jgi:hypothetical protein